jgi:repressor LexA
MNKELTAKQKKVLAVITDLTRKLGVEPTYEQVKDALGYPQISSVQRHTIVLKKKGYLKNTRGLELAHNDEQSTVSVPLVGNVACGKPIFAYENIEAYIPYQSAKVAKNKEDYFFLRAVGDSMNKATINGKTIEDGDFVLIEKTTSADYGKRVVALIGDEATIKKMVQGDGCIQLMPESWNESHKPILVFDDLLIQGIVIDVIKKMTNK